MNLEFVSRAEWGATKATEDFIRNRYSASASEKTNIQNHHTASVDHNDVTPNRWDYEEAEKYMRSLQTARPELGPLPYSINYAVSENLQTVWVFEARGVLKVGAHTAGYNRSGVGNGVFGNFDRGDGPAARVLVDAIQSVNAGLRYGTHTVPWLDYELPNLGSLKNPRGWEAWGHRDSSPKTCPGNHLYPLLADFSLEDDMPLSQEDVDRIAKASAIATANVKVKRNGQTVSWIQETADCKSLLLGLTQDANNLTDAELEAAVDDLIAALPAATLDLLKEKL